MKVNFEVSAKAARLIGRENIADVDGALSELIKNAYDADASCVYVDFFMPFPDVPSQATADRFASYLTSSDYKKVLEYYLPGGTLLHRRKDLSELEKRDLQRILFSYNKIIVADNGEGMNLDVVCSSWMQIATSTKETKVMSKKGRVKTGAKGIGRFALDKLSEKSVMYTKAVNSKTLRWTVDWEQFSSAQLLRDVNADIDSLDLSLSDLLRTIIPETSLVQLGGYEWNTGTIFVLSPTREAWNARLFEKVNTNLKSINPLGSVDQFDVLINNQILPQFSYRTEPVAIDSRDYDYKIVAEYDGANTLSVIIQRNEFDKIKRIATFSSAGKQMQFPLSSFWNRDAFKKSPYTKEDYCEGCHTLLLPVDQLIKVEDFDKVQAVGPFTAELYFVKNGKSDFAFVKDVPTRRRKEFLQHFSGVKLYRDNFKVRPYGDEGSLYDWLELNERANKSPASVSHNSGTWRVLPYQLIGVVMISRERNTALYDMANREGLTQNESYFYFVRMLQEAISRFEFDRQYIYREFDKWKKECEKKIASSTDRVKADVRNSDTHSSNNSTTESGSAPSNNDSSSTPTPSNASRFTEQEYRETVDELMKAAERDLKAKQTLEVLSSAGVILNTFFHEFSGVNTALRTRGSQMRARLDFLLNGQQYTGPAFLDPYRKLEAFDKVDNTLDCWLKVVMDAISKENFQVETVPLVGSMDKIISIWKQLLEDKSISIFVLPDAVEDQEILLKIAVIDLYVIINNFILNSVYYLEKGNQSTREIKFFITEENTTLRLRMENNGPALDEKYRTQPMLMFELGESSKPEGTGLGLWLMRDAVERSDGRIIPLDKDDGFSLEIKWVK